MKRKSVLFCMLALSALVFSCKQLVIPGHGEPAVEVSKDVQLVKINRDSATVFREFTSALKAYIYPSDAADTSICWISLDESVASVNDTGLVVGMKEGVTKIVALSEKVGKADSCVIIVLKNVHVEKVTLDKTQADIYLDETLQLTATVLPEDARIKDIVWASSDPSVAKVDESGKVTPLKEGSAKITVTSVEGSKTASCAVTVRRHAVTGVSLSKTSVSLPLGGAVQLEAVLQPENATIKTVKWTSSNEAAAVVSATGMVTAVAVGKTTITVTTDDGGFKASCEVAVKNMTQKVLTFSFATNPGGWPVKAHTHIDGGTAVTYNLEGTDYIFKLADCNGAASCNVYWHSSGYIILASKYRYFGLPAIDGYKLTKIVATHATSSKSGRTVGVANQIENNSIHPDAAAGHGFVRGGEPIDWLVQNQDYTYQLSDTEAGKMYYLYQKNSGSGFSKLVLTYDPE